MRNKRPSTEFVHGTLCRREEVANSESLPGILIVEDETLIQTLVEEALAGGGFETAIAPSAEEAVTLLRTGVTDYRALVTDINLKGNMNGWEVARRAREIDPEFPIVHVTGTAADEWASQGVPNSVLLT